jgi:hypothetical protein
MLINYKDADGRVIKLEVTEEVGKQRSCRRAINVRFCIYTQPRAPPFPVRF